MMKEPCIAQVDIPCQEILWSLYSYAPIKFHAKLMKTQKLGASCETYSDSSTSDKLVWNCININAVEP